MALPSTGTDRNCSEPGAMLRIGLISDTHGLLRPQAMEYLRGCRHIIHAGDIGHAAILDELAELAPVTAVRGNNDEGEWAMALPETRILTIGPISIYILHDLKRLAIAPATAGLRVVVSGHSHRPSAGERDGVLYVNPGSAGPRRFRLPVMAGELLVDGVSVKARLTDLADPANHVIWGTGPPPD